MMKIGFHTFLPTLQKLSSPNSLRTAFLMIVLLGLFLAPGFGIDCDMTGGSGCGSG